MHELAITQSVLDIALEHAKKHKANKITSINLVIGEMSGIVDECVRFYFESISKDTIASEATLSFETVPTKGRCRDCDTTLPSATSTGIAGLAADITSRWWGGANCILKA